MDRQPALTRHRFGGGAGWYLSTRLDDSGYAALVGRVLGEAAAAPVVAGLPAGVEAVRRSSVDGGSRSWLFLLNHGDEPVRIDAAGYDLLTAVEVGPDGLTLPARGAAVLRQG
jgi:beta-galactosidase